ncbi:hypothetical protein D3C87_1448350 [compost metagenome]
MKSVIAVLSLITLISLHSEARVGREGGGFSANPEVYQTCKGALNGTEAILVVRMIATATIQGRIYLEGSETPIVTICKSINKERAPGTPSAGRILYDCSEYGKGEGQIQIHITNGGFVGFPIARVTQAATSTTEAQHLGTLFCR